jgi:hypothetical protein
MSFNLAAIRRELHRTPELAFREEKTKLLILSWLRQISGIRIHEFSTNNGILVEYSRGEGPYRLFRADMDALPVSESTGCPFSSQNPGLMHACGHDVHMTVLLGLIERMAEQNVRRNLLFLFQPAEEGEGGAQSVIAEGLIQRFDVEAAFAARCQRIAGGNGLQPPRRVLRRAPGIRCSVLWQNRPRCLSRKRDQRPGRRPQLPEPDGERRLRPGQTAPGDLPCGKSYSRNNSQRGAEPL